jgi:cytolysin (calcineurin-like family phosphatase)
MIRKIASVAALAIATVPMVALTANMASANANPSKVTVFNQGGYVADYQISYNLNGKSQIRNLRNLRLGQKRTVTLPAGSTAVRVQSQVHTGLLWEPKRRIFDQSLNNAPAEICFKTYGTTLNAKWDNQCRADF